MGQILLAGEEAHEGPPLLRDVIADGAAERRITGLQGIENRAQCDVAVDFEPHFAIDLRERAQMRRENDANHG